MAIYRSVAMSFWTDSKVVDDFSPTDKYVYLYLFTNPHTNLCGCYEISKKQIAVETGLEIEEIDNALLRLERELDVIRYDQKTKELLIVNWHKYNWSSSDKFRVPLKKEIEAIKSVEFSTFLSSVLSGDDTVSLPYQYGSDIRARAVTVSVTDTVSVSDTDTVTVTENDSVKEAIREIVDYFNEITGKHYTYTGKDTVKAIKARLADKFTVDDFKTVIYKKTKQWKGTEMEQYIRPQTLFGNKFESYLNQSTPQNSKDELDKWLTEDIVVNETPIDFDFEVIEGDAADG